MDEIKVCTSAKRYLAYICESCGNTQNIYLRNGETATEFPWTKEDMCCYCKRVTIFGRDIIYFEKGTISYEQRAVTPPAPEFLYVLQAENDLYKIGISRKPLKRLQAINSGPVGIEMVWQKVFSDAPVIEKELHACFKDRRVRGEWFALEQEDLEYIKSL